MDKKQPLPIFAKIENLTYTINNHFKQPFSCKLIHTMLILFTAIPVTEKAKP
jgi:hypothetical protein